MKFRLTNKPDRTLKQKLSLYVMCTTCRREMALLLRCDEPIYGSYVQYQCVCSRGWNIPLNGEVVVKANTKNYNPIGHNFVYVGYNNKYADKILEISQKGICTHIYVPDEIWNSVEVGDELRL